MRGPKANGVVVPLAVVEDPGCLRFFEGAGAGAGASLSFATCSPFEIDTVLITEKPLLGAATVLAVSFAALAFRELALVIRPVASISTQLISTRVRHDRSRSYTHLHPGLYHLHN